MAGRPVTWSECSWVMRMADSDSGSTLMAAKRSKVSLRLRPASTRMRVLSVATRAELPLLEDARTETCRMSGASYKGYRLGTYNR